MTDPHGMFPARNTMRLAIDGMVAAGYSVDQIKEETEEYIDLLVTRVLEQGLVLEFRDNPYKVTVRPTVRVVKK